MTTQPDHGHLATQNIYHHRKPFEAAANERATDEGLTTPKVQDVDSLIVVAVLPGDCENRSTPVQLYSERHKQKQRQKNRENRDGKDNVEHALCD